MTARTVKSLLSDERDRVLDPIKSKMEKDLVFCNECADKSAGTPAADYYNPRGACLEHYLEFIAKLHKNPG